MCEYDLRGVGLTTPVVAILTFATRGVSISPFPDVTLNVYSYPADLIESPGDFSAQPASLQGVLTVSALQAPRTETLDVSELVTSALNGNRIVAFRFQIDPATPHAANQVFIDALDTDPVTKPFLTIGSATRGDADGDGDADLHDFAILADCLTGPDTPPKPQMPNITAKDCLWAFDGDGDADVDLDDLSGLLGSFAAE